MLDICTPSCPLPSGTTAGRSSTLWTCTSRARGSSEPATQVGGGPGVLAASLWVQPLPLARRSQCGSCRLQQRLLPSLALAWQGLPSTLHALQQHASSALARPLCALNQRSFTSRHMSSHMSQQAGKCAQHADLLLVPPGSVAAYWINYWRTSSYGGSPWHSGGGYTVAWTPSLTGDPYYYQNFTHLWVVPPSLQ